MKLNTHDRTPRPKDSKLVKGLLILCSILIYSFFVLFSFVCIYYAQSFIGGIFVMMIPILMTAIIFIPIKDMEKAHIEIKENEITFLLKWNEETLAIYPFKFEFYLTYKLENSTLKVTRKVLNRGENKMYFSLGSHESYLLEGNIEDYFLRFEKEEDFHSIVVDGDGLITDKFDNFGDNTNKLQVGYYLVKNNTAVFSNLNSRKVDLLRNNEKYASLTYDAPNFLIWTKENAPFVCLEPWFNLPDTNLSNKVLIEKPGMLTLEKGKTFISEYSITYY